MSLESGLDKDNTLTFSEKTMGTSARSTMAPSTGNMQFVVGGSGGDQAQTL